MRVVQYQVGSIVRRSARMNIRTISVLALALAIALTTIAIPANAGETPEDDI